MEKDVKIKGKDYPAVEIDGLEHVAVNGSICACGRKYEYESKIKSSDTIIVNSPLSWLPLTDITCMACLKKVREREMQYD